MKTFDVIVVGVGTMGAAACYQLAGRGASVLGIERFDIPNAMGSGHGQSRMIRLAYFEHPDYVPLLRRSYQLWDELAAELRQEVIHITGGLLLGPPGATVLEGSLRSVQQHALPHELLDSAEAMRRFPQFVIPPDYRVLHDQQAGFVRCERAIAGHAELALRRGAVLRARERVISWQCSGGGVTVTTDAAQYAAAKLIFCGGAWTENLVRQLGVPLTITRQPMAWVWPRQPELFELGRLPVWIMEHRDGTNHYGFPMLSDPPGMKLATHTRQELADPDTLDRATRPGEEADIRWMLRQHLPTADGPLLSMRICMYTNSPDHHFIIDQIPGQANVLLACGFSGHGFKFAPVIGQILAELALDGRSTLPIAFLSLDRFGVVS